MKIKQCLLLLILCSIFGIFSPPNGFSKKSDATLYPGFPLLTQSEAYNLFLKRPINDYSKLIFLIDRFAEAEIKILYNGYYFDAPFASKFARWFMARRYTDETPEQWIMKWCNTSIVKSELIWVKLPDGNFLLSRDILLNELKKLEKELLEHSPEAKLPSVEGVESEKTAESTESQTQAKEAAA